MKDCIAGVRWLLARSDVEAAVKLLTDEICPLDGTAKYVNYIKNYWPQYFCPDAYRKVYKEAGEVEAKVVGIFHAITATHRYQVVNQAFMQVGRPQRVLDFGCSRAYHAIHLHNAFASEFTCVDIDEQSIAEANLAIARYARVPRKMEAVVADSCDRFVGKDYDAVMCLETLEHVPDIYPLLERFEQCVKPGGWIVITLPHGPVEYTMWVDHPERNREHLREIAVQDCYELWNRKPSFYMTLFAGGVNKYAGMTEGSIVVMYKADGQPTGKINMERKILGALACEGPELPDGDGVLK